MAVLAAIVGLITVAGSDRQPARIDRSATTTTSTADLTDGVPATPKPETRQTMR